MPEDRPESESTYSRVGRSAIGQLHANVAHVEQSAVQRLTAQSIEASGSALGIVNGTTVELKESAVGVAAGDYVRVEDSRVFVLLAPRVSGNVKAVLTLPAAFALGAGYFLARFALKALLNRSQG